MEQKLAMKCQWNNDSSFLKCCFKMNLNTSNNKINRNTSAFTAILPSRLAFRQKFPLSLKSKVPDHHKTHEWTVYTSTVEGKKGRDSELKKGRELELALLEVTGNSFHAAISRKNVCGKQTYEPSHRTQIKDILGFTLYKGHLRDRKG